MNNHLIKADVTHNHKEIDAVADNLSVMKLDRQS